jgi:hypothetical protein
MGYQIHETYIRYSVWDGYSTTIDVLGIEAAMVVIERLLLKGNKVVIHPYER